MALGAAYEDDAITALANSPAQPKPAPEKASVWRTLPEDIGRSATGLAMGSARALTEIAATGADVVGSLRATGIATPEERRQMQRTGAPISSYSSELGDYLRSAGGIFEPDPATASVAEQVLYGFGRGATKIVGGALAAGPVGVLAAGAEEAVTQADELRLQGVDFNARTKAGAVQGAGLALAALPVVGQTAKATAGLYAIGGPGGFMAQQALTREILQGAGYDKIGAQFDPFDPVGLAVASLLPAGFAAYGLRQQKLQRAVDSLPDLPPRADVAPPAADTAPPTPFPSRPSAITNAVRAYPTEAVDAARVVLLAERRAAANPGAPDNLRAMDQHEAALSRAEDQIAAGEPVQVADVAPAAPEQVKSAIGNTGRFDPTTGSLTDSPYATWADQITAAIREMQAQARPADLPMLAPYVDGIPPPAAGMVRLYRADSPTVKFSDVFNADQLGAFKRPEGMTGQRLTTDLKLAQYYRSSYGPDAVISYVDVPAAALEGRAGAAGEFFIDVQARPTDAPTTTQAANPEAAAPARGAGDAPAAAGAAGTGRPATGVEAAGIAPVDGAAILADVLRPVAPAVADQIDNLLGRGAPADAAPAEAAMASRMEMVQQQFPALEVAVDGMDKPMPVAEFLAAVKAEADDLQADAPLMQLAAECAILNSVG